MTRESHEERASRATSQEPGTTHRLAECLMEAVAGIGYNAQWYDEQAVRAIEMGREFTRRMLIDTAPDPISRSMPRICARVARATRSRSYSCCATP